MSLFAGLPVPKLTNPDELALQSREVMVRALTQGMALGQRRREHKDEIQDRKDFRESKAIAAAQVQARKQFKMGVYEQAVSGLKSEKEFLEFSSQNVGFALDPDTSPGVQAMTKMFQNMGRIETGTSAAKVKVTENHVTNRFNDNLEFIASDPENDELVAAISFKRRNPTTMPDPPMLEAVAKAKQSLLQKQAVAKETERASRFGDASIKRLYTEDNVPVDVLNRPGGVPERIPSHQDDEKARAQKELSELKKELRSVDTNFQEKRADAFSKSLDLTPVGKQKAEAAKVKALAIREYREDLKARIEALEKTSSSAQVVEAQAAPAETNAPKQINSQAEYDAFEGGAYIDSTGKKAFKKPKSAP